MRRLLCLSLVILPLATVLAEEERLQRLAARLHDELVLPDGEVLPGTAVEVRDDGTILFQALGKDGRVAYAPHQYKDHRPPLTVAEILTKNQAILLSRPYTPGLRIELERHLSWALDNDAADQAYGMLVAAAKKYPSERILIGGVISDLEKGGRKDDILTVAKVGIAATPDWEQGHTFVIQAARDAGDSAAQNAAVAEALRARPEHLLANKLEGNRLAAAGKLEEALTHYRKASRRGDTESLVGLALTSYLLGDQGSARSAVKRLEEGDQDVAAAVTDLVIGTDDLRGGRFQEAAGKLQKAMDFGFTGPVDRLVRHNLGVARYRLGQTAAAITVWQGMDRRGPATNLAMAIAKKQPVRLADYEDGELRSIAVELNASLNLSNPEGDISAKALEGLSPERKARHGFLDKVRGLRSSRGTPISVAAVRLTRSNESLRWQAYGHILAGRVDEAQEIAEQLPENDGYAAVIKVYAAGKKGQKERARELYQKLLMPLAEGRVKADPPPPDAYVSLLAAEFAASGDGFRRVDFDWPDGDVLGTGWATQALGTGIRIHVAQSKLVLEGTQGGTGVSRAYLMVREDSISDLLLDLAADAAGEATVGLEILDDSLQNGSAVGILPGGKLQWRSMTNGRYGAWTDLPGDPVFEPGKPLRLVYLRNGRVAVPDKDPRREPFHVGDAFAPTKYLAVSIFGEAPSGSQWRLSADRLDMR